MVVEEEKRESPGRGRAEGTARVEAQRQDSAWESPGHREADAGGGRARVSGPVGEAQASRSH